MPVFEIEVPCYEIVSATAVYHIEADNEEDALNVFKKEKGIDRNNYKRIIDIEDRFFEVKGFADYDIEDLYICEKS